MNTIIDAKYGDEMDRWECGNGKSEMPHDKHMPMDSVYRLRWLRKKFHYFEWKEKSNAHLLDVVVAVFAEYVEREALCD